MPGDQLRHGLAAVEDEAGSDRRRHVDALRVVIRHYRIPQNDLAPSNFWVSSTATALPPWKTIVSAAATVGATSSGRSMRRQMTPIACNTGSAPWPIGYCHGLPSPPFPRMLTKLRNRECPPLVKGRMV